MKYEVEITYVIKADSPEEARKLVINECSSIRIEDIKVRRVE